MQNVKNTMIDRLLSVVAPHLCCGCGKIGTLLCPNCKYDISTHRLTSCIVCKRPNLVGICMDHNITYKRAWVVGERRDTLQRLIGGFKFQNMKAAAAVLAELLNEQLPSFPAGVVIVPIPTAPSHIRERGYDHMLLIAKYLADSRRLPVETIVGRNNTATQHHANRENRLLQAQTAFRLNHLPDPGKIYLLIDDVVTTGSTIDQASRLLTEAGAIHVWVGALARQPLD